MSMLHKPPIKTETASDFMRERLKKVDLKFSQDNKTLRKKDMPRFGKVLRRAFLELVRSDVPLDSERLYRDFIARQLESYWFPLPARHQRAKDLAELAEFYRTVIEDYAKRLSVPKTKARAHFANRWGFPSAAALVQFLKRERRKRYKKL